MQNMLKGNGQLGGSGALRAGGDAELRVRAELDNADWLTRQGAQLDYAQKTDVQAVCPGRSVFNLQVSLGPKSQREQRSLESRGVIPMSVSGLEASRMTAPEYICTNVCERQLCVESLAAMQPQADLPAAE